MSRRQFGCDDDTQSVLPMAVSSDNLTLDCSNPPTDDVWDKVDHKHGEHPYVTFTQEQIITKAIGIAMVRQELRPTKGTGHGK